MRKPNPLQDANFCSRLFFWWLTPLFKIGHERRLEEDDMYSVLPEDRSQHLGEELQGYWDQEVSKADEDAREPSLTKAIIKCHWKSYLVWGIFILLEEGTRVAQPIFLGKMINYVENSNRTDSAALHEAYGYAAGLSASVLVWAVLHHFYFYHIQRVGMRLRVAVCHMIYRKALRLSSSAMGKTTTGQIVNLLSNDVSRFDQVTMFLHYLWVGPLQAITVTALLWMEIGMSCLAGMAVLIILLLLQSRFGKFFSSLRSETSALTDDRIRTMSEVISGIKTVKMNAWEKSFIDLISTLRRKEISKILKSSYLRGMNLASFFAVSKVMIFVTFITNDLLDNRITASQVFVVVTLFEALWFSSTLYFPMAVEKVSEAIVSIQRIEDLQLLEDGDQTVIGDGGTPLSEGQKAWVSLARAVYQDADIYLLDDPFSAVDVGVSRHLFEQCICQALREKITILVTHQWQYLKAASWIMILKGGKIVQCGTYIELLKSGVDFDFLLKRNEEEPSPDMESSALKNQSRPLMRGAAPELQDTENIEVTLPLEGRLEGKVGIKTYNNYITAGAQWFIIIFLILVNIAAQVAYTLQDWWLAYWAKLQSALYFGVYGKEEILVMLDLNWYLEVYSGLTFSTVLFGITRSLLIFYVLVNSSQTLHNKMLCSILKAPVLFFYRNPIGRILNRFLKDLGHMDDLLPLIFQDFIQTFLLVIGVVGVMVAAIPWIAIPVILLGIIFFVLQWYFLRTSRDVKRLECTTRSPVFSHFASSLRGLWTIRAYKAEQRFQELFDAYQDLHSEAWFLLLTTSRWLAVYLDVICAIFVTVVAFGALILVETLDLGEVGLVLSLTVTLTGMFQWCVRQSAEVENMMISVERVIEYTDLEKEAPWEYEYRPPPSWPHGGWIGFYYINFRYSLDGPLVLKNLGTFIDPREKLGIVGRTGAGKSSLIAALFRLSEPEGNIYIDTILTRNVGLHDLRKKMSVVPQEPVLFIGTMRKNLDPFNEYLEEELWNVLEEVQLKEAIEALPSEMDTELAESGLNLSVGQRQLVCLARAILRKNQILILDKATSNVDPRTDELIQKTIHEKFAQCTVLTITQRLSTIIDCEWILVLDSGIEKEYTRPYDLLQNADSLFYKMVQTLGKAEASALTERAKQVHSERK